MQVGNLIRPTLPRQLVRDPSLVLDLPLYKLDGQAFNSVDAYGHLATNTGALWTPNGRTFDGVDDLLTLGRITELEGASAQWTIEFWFKLTDNLTNVRCFFAYDANDLLQTNDCYMYWQSSNLQIQYQMGGGEAEKASPVVSLADLGWHHIIYGKSATNALIYFDAALIVDTAFAGGAFTSSYTLKFADNFNVNFGKGTYGAIRIHNRLLTPWEILGRYIMSKGRYL